jgi:hypothetical protein
VSSLVELRSTKNVDFFAENKRSSAWVRCRTYIKSGVEPGWTDSYLIKFFSNAFIFFLKTYLGQLLYFSHSTQNAH